MSKNLRNALIVILFNLILYLGVIALAARENMYLNGAIPRTTMYYFRVAEMMIAFVSIILIVSFLKGEKIKKESFINKKVLLIMLGFIVYSLVMSSFRFYVEYLVFFYGNPIWAIMQEFQRPMNIYFATVFGIITQHYMKSVE